mmetsp:Transcript_9073/g.22456  ORF Transcript_9073/g.22456 Transcript_9073/m.22456 type:complete len:341 (+) Transcript_9073:2152-3174(+)
MVRSCASSRMTTLYCVSVSSSRHSRSSMPSVMYLITVSLDVQSSKRMAYPTSSPRRHPNSSATRLATLMAATRRGCVHPILPRDVYPTSARYCVICVVLPDPVSPMTTSTWLSFTAAISCSLSLKMGSDSRCSLMERLSLMPYVTALPMAFVFHSGTSLVTSPMPRSSCASARSLGSAMGSSQGLLRSLGMASSSVRCCCSLSSRRSLASADCVMAERCMEPSGFFTILMGLISMPERDDTPLRKEGSLSLRSTSNSSSPPSSAPASTPSPDSASYVGSSSTVSTPDAASCLASHASCSVSLRPGRRSARGSSMSSCRTLMPDSPLSPLAPSPGCPSGPL